MAFNPQAASAPTAVGNIVIILKDAFDEEGAPYQSAHFQINIQMSDGRTVHRRGDLVPHITPAQRQGLMDFMVALRMQAGLQILG